MHGLRGGLSEGTPERGAQEEPCGIFQERGGRAAECRTEGERPGRRAAQGLAPEGRGKDWGFHPVAGGGFFWWGFQRG